MSLSKKVVAGMSWNLFGFGVTFIVSLFYSIILARSLHSIGYGELMFSISFIGFITIFTSLGFESTLNKYIPHMRVKKEEHVIPWMLTKMMGMRMAIGFAIAVFLMVFSNDIAEFLFLNRAYGPYIAMGGVISIPISVQNLMKSYLASSFKQRSLNLVDSAARLMNFILAVTLVWVGMGVAGALLALLISTIFIDLVYVIICTRRSGTAKYGRKGNVGVFWKYSAIMFFYGIMNYFLAQQLDILLLGRYSTSSEISFYSIAYSFSYLSLSVFAMALSGGLALTFFSELYAKRDFIGLKKAYTFLFEYLFIFIIPMAAGGMILSKEIVSLLYGGEYLPVVPILLIYFPVMAISKLGGITSTYLSAMDSEKLLITSRILFGTTNLVLDLLLIPRFGAMGAVFATSVATVFGVAFESFMVHKLVHPHYPGGFFIKTLAASLAMGAAIFALRYITDSFLVLFLSGTLVYMVLIFLFKPFSEDSKKMVASLKLPMKGMVLRFIGWRGGP